MKEKESQTATTIDFLRLLRLQSVESAGGKKSDRKTCGSEWTHRMFSEYQDCFPTKFDLELKPLFDENYSKATVDRIKYVFTEKAKILDNEFTGNTEEIPNLFYSKLKSEAKVKCFIVDLLTQVLNQIDLRLEPEEPLEFPGLPTSRADYVIFTKKTKRILGCVEVKWSESFDKDALVQCQLQLLSLHTKVNHSLFGIVTDAYGFIFMKLDANGIFHLEKETPIREFKNWDAFYETLGVINRLICDGLNEPQEVCTTPEQGEFALKLIRQAVTIFNKAARIQHEKGKGHLEDYLYRKGIKIARVWAELAQTSDQWKIAEDPWRLETIATRGHIGIHFKFPDFIVVERKIKNSSRCEKSTDEIVVTMRQIRYVVEASLENLDFDPD